MGYKVLVIDDSPLVFKAVKKALEPHGYEMAGQAFDGREGLQMVDELKPDIIILDITMPVMDGLETAKHLSLKNLTKKVIMSSAMGDEELISKAKHMGITYFLPKPFKPEDLVEAARNLI